MDWLLIYILIGLFVGLIAGLFGIGGGTTIVPLLVLTFLHQGFKNEELFHLALGTSLASIVITSISSIYNHNKKKAINEFLEIKKKYSVPVVVQEFLDGVIYGDKRVILIDGKPEGVINRIPKKGEFKANLHLGGQAKQTTLTKKEKKICMEIKKTLKKEKLFFVGIDLINEKLTEINVTSPTGIVQILNLSGIDLAKKLWQKLLKKMT